MSTSARTPHKPGVVDLVRREWYMARLDWSLRNLPSMESRRIRKDLRRNLKDSSSDVGTVSALADLSSPGVLAQHYTTDVDREGPRYTTGALAVGLVVAAILSMLFAYAIGILDTLVEVGGGSRTANLWGSETIVTGSSSEFSVEMTNILPALAVLVAISAVVFLLFARIWRLSRTR